MRSVACQRWIELFEEHPDESGGRQVLHSVDDGCLALYFEDNGAGIPRNELPMVFEPFFSTKRRREGIRIGLATTRKILEMYGGAIDVRSTEGEGTRFDLMIRLASDKSTQ